MTLLEAVIAFVILSVVGVVCLDQSRAASQLQVASAEWTRAIARGESALAEAVAGAPSNPDPVSGASADANVRVQRRTWRAGIDLIEVTVPLANGAQYVATRLTPSAPVRR